jgi:type IV pilus assembly protein PilV
MDRQDPIDMKARFLNNKQGFTLVEFLIAVVILAVGLLALINLQWMAIRGNSDSKEMTRAVFLAEKKMEVLKNIPYGSLALVTAQQDANNPMNGLEQTGGIFNRSWTIQSYSGSSFMKQITVNVSWTLKGQSHTVSDLSVVAR